MVAAAILVVLYFLMALVFSIAGTIQDSDIFIVMGRTGLTNLLTVLEMLFLFWL